MMVVDAVPENKNMENGLPFGRIPDHRFCLLRVARSRDYICCALP